MNRSGSENKDESDTPLRSSFIQAHGKHATRSSLLHTPSTAPHSSAAHVAANAARPADTLEDTPSAARSHVDALVRVKPSSHVAHSVDALDRHVTH